MKKKITTLGILSLLLFNSYHLNAQALVEKIAYDTNGSVSMVVLKKGIDKTALIGAKGKSPSASLNKLLKISDKIEFRFKQSDKTIRNFHTETYQTYINNIIIDGGEYKMNYKDDELISIAGRSYDAEKFINTSPKISESQALSYALKSVNAKSYAWDDKSMDTKFTKINKPKGELVIVPLEAYGGDFSLTLAYKFDVYATQPLSRDYIYVDAETGLIIKKDAIIKHLHINNNKPLAIAKKETPSFFKKNLGNAATRYSGSQSIDADFDNTANSYTLTDETSRGTPFWTANMQTTTSTANLIDFIDNDNDWTAAEHDNTNKDNAALDAHWGVTKTYDYYKNNFGRESYDNKGTALISLVHYSTNYENAFWSGAYMVYGDGANTFDVLTAFDVTAHELTHGVTSTTSQLEYNRESGALNEGLSDIFAALVENQYAPDKEAFLIGEDITKTTPSFLRSMSNPKDGDQPDTYKGENWMAASVEDGCFAPSQTGNDYCGVHINSGVLNHWFYILVQGKSGTNDKEDIYNVQGIGWQKAGDIVYSLQTSYLTSKSNFKNTRDYAIQIATDLYGPNSPEAIAVQDAFYAVGIGGKYLATPDTEAPTTPTNLITKNTTGDATTLNWNASVDNTGLYEYVIYQNNEEVARTQNIEYRVTGLSQSNTYTFKVKAIDLYNNSSSISNEATATTTSIKSGCLSTAYNSTILNISNVELNTINNSSAKAFGYEDFSFLNTELTAGETYDLKITSNTAQYNANFAVFLDKNNSGGSLPNSELIATGSLVKNQPLTTIPLTIPADAVTDAPLRLRIIQNNAAITPTSVTGCIAYNYGQVEDYSITIKPKILGVENFKFNDFTIYPNPAKDFITINSTEKELVFKIFDVSGALIDSGKTNGKINVQKLPKGNYILNINHKGTSRNQKFIKE